MSLLNQVLRDLDRRQVPHAAPLGGASPTLRPPLVNPHQRLLRWAAGGVLTAAAVVVGGWAQGSIAWPARSPAESGPLPRPSAPTAVAEPVSTVAPAAPAPVALAPASLAPASVAPSPSAPARVALAPMTLPAPPARPHRAAMPRPAPEAAASATPASAAARSEPRIDKHVPSRTPQERAEAQYQRGVAAHQAGLIDESAVAFMAALREEPRFAPARLAQAGVLIGQSRQDEALALLQDGIALAPAQPQLALMLARLQAERQDLGAALATLSTASAGAANNAEYQGFHAAILQRANRHGEAVEKFSAALRLAPGHSVWWMGLGISLAATGQVEPAREAFSRAKATGGLPAEAGLYVDARLRQMM